MILKNNHFIWKIDPPSHRCRGTWIIRVLALKCPKIGMLPWFFIPIVEFIIQLLSKFTRISHFCTKKFQQGDIGWYICHLLLMWIFIWTRLGCFYVTAILSYVMVEVELSWDWGLQEPWFDLKLRLSWGLGWNEAEVELRLSMIYDCNWVEIKLELN